MHCLYFKWIFLSNYFYLCQFIEMKKIAPNLKFAKVHLSTLAELISIHQFIILSFILFGNICTAQLPVRMEPRHHKVFENDYVRVLDVNIVPGDTSLFHIHEIPSVFIIIANAKTVF